MCAHLAAGSARSTGGSRPCTGGCLHSRPERGSIVRVDQLAPDTWAERMLCGWLGTQVQEAAHRHSHTCLKSTPLSGANKIATEALSVPTETLARASMCGSYLRMYTDTLHAEPGSAGWAQLALLL